MVNISQKKVQVSSPGRAELAWASNPCTQNIKTREGNVFVSKNFPPLIQKSGLTKACGFCSPKPLLGAFCFHFWCFYSLQQVSIQSLSFLLPIGVFSSSFGAPNCENVIIFVGQFWFVFMLDFLELGI